MALIDPAWWSRFEYERLQRLLQEQERQRERDKMFRAAQQTNDRELIASLPDIREAVAQIEAAMIDPSELSYADYTELHRLCIAMAAVFGAFQQELRVFDAG